MQKLPEGKPRGERETGLRRMDDVELELRNMGVKNWTADHGGRAVCGRSLAGIAGSNLAGGMDVCVL